MDKILKYFKSFGFITWIILIAIICFIFVSILKILPYFSFLDMRAGFDIGQSVLAYTPDNTYWWAILVGLVNSLYVSIICIVISSFVGFFIGLGRISKNWLLARLCGLYVEIFRNIPLLLIILIFYFLILFLLPDVRQSYNLGGILFLNKRGLHFPQIAYFSLFLPLLLAALIAVYYFIVPRITVKYIKIFYILSFFGVILLIAAFYLIMPVEYPRPSAFNILGGGKWTPEFLALVLGISLYSASFCAEIIRAGILSVDKGIIEASKSLGMSFWQIKQKITMPIALRIIIPPLTNSYISLIKNTSLAVAIGFPDFVAVTSTILNQTSKAVEIVLLWFIVYGSLSLFVSFIMNYFNKNLYLQKRR
ncbi:ABC transporter permease subunit [Bartonella sp. DGB1]|uniref:ABC transporter permease subunit n=1 Tax=Bartonella sp. DGB1 TaxID=3239807 RepID=UPI00352433C8